MDLKSQHGRLVVLLALALIATTAVAYWGVFGSGFTNFDDPGYVSANPRVYDGFSAEGLRWAMGTYRMGNWHPLTWYSHMLVGEIGGSNPGVHHAGNLALHIANSLLLFWVLFRMTGAPRRSFVVAALFALHPLHVESVAWISARKDVLSTLFWLLTMWAYLGYVRRPSPGRYLPVLGFFALGLMSKAMLVTLPAVLLLIDLWPLDRKRHPRLLLEKLPLLAVSLAASYVAVLAQSGAGAVKTLDALSVPARMINAVIACSGYVWKMLVPIKLSIFYPHDSDPALWVVLVSGLFVGVATYLALHLRKTHPYVLFGWSWYLISLLPVIGIVQIGAQSMADRYTYLPLIGLFVVAAWGLPELAPVADWRRSAVFATTFVVICACMLLTERQVRHWKNSATLFGHAVSVTANNYLAHHKLGEAMLEQGRNDDAAEEFSNALRIKPNLGAAHDKLGLILVEAGRFSEAIDRFDQALRANPNDPNILNNMGVALGRAGRVDEALIHFESALRLDPGNVNAKRNLGSLGAAGPPGP